MKILAIDTATTAIGVGLAFDGRVVASFQLEGTKRHAETIVPAIEQALASSGCRYADLDAIAVDIGPGLFTGLRVGVATAKAIAMACNKPVLAVSSLEVVAHAYASARPASDGEIVVVIDARRREVYAQMFGFSAGGVVARDDAFVAPPAQVAMRAATPDAGQPLVVIGGGVAAYPDAFSHLATAATGPPPIAALLALAERVEPMDPDDVELLYLRAPDAEINWVSRAPVTS